MATRIFAVDLSGGDEKDFLATATEPGLAMLDRQGANAAIMRKWFGNLVADPSFSGGRADFFVQAQGGGRLDNVECLPATKEDLEGPLSEELKAIQAKIKKARPEDGSEQSLHRVVRKTFADLTKDLDQSDYDSYFFKYRVGREPWRLVWAWGYQRADREPAPSVICTNPDCEQLFVRRSKGKAACPGCSETVIKRRVPLVGRLLWPVAAGLLAFLILALLLFFLGQPALVVEPADREVAMGEDVPFKVTQTQWFVFTDDVTGAARPHSSDKDVLEFNGGGLVGKAKRPGESLVTFRVNGLSVESSVTVKAPKTPDRLTIEPNDLRLSLGERRPLKVVGHYPGGKKIDLTELIEEWEAADAAVAYVDGGVVEAMGEGETTVSAAYAASSGEKSAKGEASVAVSRAMSRPGLPERLVIEPARLEVLVGAAAPLTVTGEYADGRRQDVTSLVSLWEVEDPTLAYAGGGAVRGLQPGETTLRAVYREKPGDVELREITVPLVVTAGEFQSIELAVAPAAIHPGERALVQVLGRTADGGTHQVDQGAVVLTVDNYDVAAPVETVAGQYMIGKQPGQATVIAHVGRLTARAPLDVRPLAAGTFAVSPAVVEMIPYEYLRVNVSSADAGEIAISSSDAGIVSPLNESAAVFDGAELVALSAGEAVVTIKQGMSTAAVKVHVRDRQIEGLRIDPQRITLRSGERQRIRVLGTVVVDGFTREVELSPSVLRWLKEPRYDYAALDHRTLMLLGGSPTPAPQPLHVSIEGTGLSAVALVSVERGGRPAHIDVTVDNIEEVFSFDTMIPWPPIGLDTVVWGDGIRFDHRRGGFRLDSIPEDSVFGRYRAMLPKGAVFKRIGDTSFEGMTLDEIRAWLEANPELADGVEIVYQLPDGRTDSFVYRRPITGDTQEVRIEDQWAIDPTETDTRIGLQVFVEEYGQYRILREAAPSEKAASPDEDYLIVSDWYEFAPGTVNKMETSGAAPISSDNRYLIVIERKQPGSEETEDFPTKITLRSAKQ